MARPLIVCMEAPERFDDTEPESLANIINHRLGPDWINLYVWDEEDFDRDVDDYGSVTEAVDAMVKR